MDKLVSLRKEQKVTEQGDSTVSYESLLAPIYFKAGDFLVTYIMLNTDELGTVKPFQEEPDSDDEGESNEKSAQSGAQQNEQTPAEEAKQEEVPPQTMMINTSKPAEPAPASNENGAATKEEGESYEQEALNYLSLALQIIGDFSSENVALCGDVAERKKIMAFLQIDTLLSRVSLFNNAPDYKSALEDLALVEQLCIEFPDQNEATLTSAIFQMGRCEMELKEFDKAHAYFTRT